MKNTKTLLTLLSASTLALSVNVAHGQVGDCAASNTQLFLNASA